MADANTHTNHSSDSCSFEARRKQYDGNTPPALYDASAEAPEGLRVVGNAHAADCIDCIPRWVKQQ